MKQLVICAVAASMASASALASESEWATLDRDVQALSASLSGLEDSNTKFSGYIRAAYVSSGDVAVGANDLGDFDILEARLKASGTRHGIDYVFQIGAESAGSASLLKDAYLNIPIGANLKVRAGQFKGIICRDSLVSTSKLFFADRSQIGGLFSTRREGIALLGEFEGFDWAVTIQDGTDSAGDEYLLALRGEIDLLGDGIDMVEGAYGAGDVEATAAVSYWDDGAVDNGDGLLFQATLTSKQYSLNAYVADISEGLVTSNGSSSTFPGGVMATGLIGDSTPFGIMGTFMIAEPTASQGGWEVGLRFQDLDNGDADTSIIDVGLNYYGAGHDYKYFLHWQSINSTVVGTSASADADIIRLGVNLGF